MFKSWKESKTIIFFALSLVVAVAGLFGFGSFEPSVLQAEIFGVVMAVAGIILRLVTSQGIEF